MEDEVVKLTLAMVRDHFRRNDPIRNRSMARAAFRPSLMAHTTSDCPRRISPAAKTPGTELM
jgi:hypothetical protein